MLIRAEEQGLCADEEGVEGFEGGDMRGGGGGGGAGRWNEVGGPCQLGRLRVHVASSCRVLLWPPPHPDVRSVPRPVPCWLSTIQIMETISEEVVVFSHWL